MNLEYPYFKGQLHFGETHITIKTINHEWPEVYYSLKNDPAVAALYAALTPIPDGLADTAPYFRSGGALNVGICCVAAQYEAKVVTERCINAADVPAASPFSAGKVAAIRSDPELLKSYILHIVQLENNIKTLEKQLPDVYFHKIINGILVEAVDYKTSLDTRTAALGKFQRQVEKATEKSETLENDYQHCLTLIKNQRRVQPKIPSAAQPQEPQPPELEKPGLFNKKKVEERNRELTAQYEAALAAYDSEVARLQKEAEEQQKQLLAEMQHDADEARKKADAAKEALNKAQRQLAEAEADVEGKCAEAVARPTPASEAQKILDNETAQTMELLQKSITARNELYAAGIIFGKYQNAVALSSFYEYLVSGRCEKLEGTNGAYNLYESEVRANRVIEQLDTVIDSLEQIKSNQYMMYSAMCSMKKELAQLNDTMNSALTAIYSIENSASDAVIQLEGISQIGTTIAKNSDVIAHNTAATAYYAKKNAELTDAMGYLVALK